MSGIRGQSSVTGSILLVGIVVILSGATAVYFMEFGGQMSQSSASGIGTTQNNDGSITVRLNDLGSSAKVVVQGSDGSSYVLNETGESVTIPPSVDYYSVVSVSDSGSRSLLKSIDIPNVSSTATPGTVTFTPSPTATPTATVTSTPMPDPAGQLQWSYTGDGSLSAPTANSDTIYVTSNSGSVYALNYSDGSARWTTSYADDFSMWAPTTLNSKVFVSGSGGTTYALDGYTGSEVWTYSNGGSQGGDMSPAAGHVIVPVENGYVYALDPSSGAEQWQIDHTTVTNHDDQRGAAEYDTSSGGMFTVDDHETAYRHDPTDGSEVWTYTSPNSTFKSSPVVGGGNVYYLDGDGTVYALDKTGDGVGGTTVTWQTTLAIGDGSGAVEYASGTVFVEAGGQVHALDSTDGSVQWSTTTNGGLGVTYANGVVYSGGDKLYALDASTGSVEWSYDPAAGDVNQMPIVIDGTAYVTAGDTVYAVSTGDTATSDGARCGGLNPIDGVC